VSHGDIVKGKSNLNGIDLQEKPRHDVQCSLGHDFTHRRVDESDSRFAGCDTSIVDHGKDRATDWSRAKRSIDEVKFAVNPEECEPDLSPREIRIASI
jgi:hypothetical protein